MRVKREGSKSAGSKATAAGQPESATSSTQPSSPQLNSIPDNRKVAQSMEVTSNGIKSLENQRSVQLQARTDFTISGPPVVQLDDRKPGENDQQYRERKEREAVIRRAQEQTANEAAERGRPQADNNNLRANRVGLLGDMFRRTNASARTAAEPPMNVAENSSPAEKGLPGKQ